MGKSGAQLTRADHVFHDSIMELLAPLGDINSRSMFGGYGLFESGDMFALISKAKLYFKVDASSRPAYEEAGSERHLPMPYYEVPDDVMEHPTKLHEWGRTAIAIAHSTAKKNRSTSKKRRGRRTEG
jgi:DNA transformation protein